MFKHNISPHFLQTSNFSFYSVRRTCWNDVFQGKHFIRIFNKMGQINIAKCTYTTTKLNIITEITESFKIK